MSTGEFLNATVMYHRENRLRLSRQRRKPVDPPVLSAAAARLAGENVGAATWSEDLSEGVATNPVVIPPNFSLPIPPLDSNPTNQPFRHRYQVAWGPDESLSEVMGSTEPLINHHAYDDDTDDCIHSSNNVTVHQSAKAKVVHTADNPTYQQMQKSPTLTAIWQPLFHAWFQTSLASGQVMVVSKEEARDMNVQFIKHLNLTKTKADGTHKVRNAPNGSGEDKNNFSNPYASGVDQTGVRFLMAFAAFHNLEIRQGDVVDAYGSNNKWDDPANVRTRPLATIMEPWETGLEEAVIMIYVGVPAGVRDAPSMFEMVLARSLLTAAARVNPNFCQDSFR